MQETCQLRFDLLSFIESKETQLVTNISYEVSKIKVKGFILLSWSSNIDQGDYTNFYDALRVTLDIVITSKYSFLGPL